MNSISQMPLVETLFAAAQERFSFHMPGNRHGKSFPGWLRDNLWSLDTTELAQTGDIRIRPVRCNKRWIWPPPFLAPATLAL